MKGYYLFFGGIYSFPIRFLKKTNLVPVKDIFHSNQISSIYNQRFVVK
jgi:hypothetical protein